MKIIEFSASKGGVGTTNVACSVAMAYANAGHNVLLMDLGMERDTSGWFGVQRFDRSQDHIQVAYNISLFSPWWQASTITSVPIPEGEWDVVVVDAGREKLRYNGDLNIERVYVMTNDYLSMRNTVGEQNRADRYVAVIEDGKVLTYKDVCNVIGANAVRVHRTEQQGRRIDAGTAPAHAMENEWVREFLPLVVA